MFKNVDDFQKFSKEQFEAVTSVGSAWSKGVQQIAAEATDYSKKSFEASSGMMEKLMGVKSVEKAVEIQTEFAKQSYESFVAQTTKFGELFTNLAKDTFKPVEEIFAKVQAADGQMTLPIHPFAQSAAEHGSQSRIRDTEQQLVHSPLAQGGLVKARAAHG